MIMLERNLSRDRVRRYVHEILVNPGQGVIA
jgi:hypothetical protein